MTFSFKKFKIYICITTSKKTKHIKNGNKKNSSKEDKKSKKEGRKKIFRDPCHANQFGGKKIPSSSAPSLSPKSSVCFFVRGPRIENGENGGKKTIQEYTRLRKKNNDIKFPWTFQEKHLQGGKSQFITTKFSLSF